MHSSNICQKNIFNHKVKAYSILQALAPLTHVAYLKNDGFPVIALCADEYFLLQNSQFFQFVKQDFNCYQKIPIDHFPLMNYNSSETNDHKTFKGGYLGFISYDFGASRQIVMTEKSQPSLFLGHFSIYLTWSSDGWILHSPAESIAEVERFILSAYNTPTLADFSLKTPCTARWDKGQYSTAFQQVQEYIKAGDCYQINLTQEFTAHATGSLLAAAEEFWQLTDAPYSGYLRVDDFELLSCSPELFIDFEANRRIVTKPIKGTMPRFQDPDLDEESKQALQRSEKDRAENVMIVDLLRNDLSVFSEIGSVKTPKLFNIESFKQVHHMVSEVNATLNKDVNPFDVLLSALPGGSITGAPKIRAMQIIDELEGAPRGAYCGSLGYFNDDGTGSWNILIRSIQKYQNDVSLWAGGGITIASECDAEYQECFDKVEAMLNLLNTWYRPE